jgi:hypothetical protein
MGLVTLLALIAHQIPIFFIMKRELGNESWIFSTSLPVWGMHLSISGKPGLYRENP